MSDLSKYEVKITAPAFADIRAIASYTFEQWGQGQARLYMSQIDNKIEALERDPDLGRERYGLPKAIKGCKSGSHIIFYRVQNRVIFIMRILHQSMDHGRHIAQPATPYRRPGSRRVADAGLGFPLARMGGAFSVNTAFTVSFLDNICVMGWPNGPARTLTSELSGGMKKRASAARALAMDSELLFSMNQPPR